MTKTEFIKTIREFANTLEANDYQFINLPEDGGYVFGNRNYGELVIQLNKFTEIKVNLFTATEEEREGAEVSE